jgi:hypothetical protein
MTWQLLHIHPIIFVNVVMTNWAVHPLSVPPLLLLKALLTRAAAEIGAIKRIVPLKDQTLTVLDVAQEASVRHRCLFSQD